MVSFFDRINLVQSHLFDWTASIQVTVSSSIYRCIFIEICVTVSFSPRNIQRYCFIIPILIYRCAWVTVLKWTNDYMCVCVFAYMFLLLLRVGTHHYRLTTNWNGWKRVLYILLLLLLMLFVNNYTIERNSNSMTTNYNDVGEWNGTVREKKYTHSHIKSHPVGVPGYCVRFDLLRFVYIWTNSKRMFTVFIIQIETAWQVFRCCVCFFSRSNRYKWKDTFNSNFASIKLNNTQNYLHALHTMCAVKKTLFIVNIFWSFFVWKSSQYIGSCSLVCTLTASLCLNYKLEPFWHDNKTEMSFSFIADI